ncbi:PorT family protein [Aquiflexum sp. TKW24L]|uniref:porin family protein n=1 Tax=Aquiflexum sp. TKW24L TaxID=2942212 RepID=UPI0020C0D3E7|nr:porin family protein [Aquiflexum sp. TKW24L]MCL6261578.1 PorT family protein [Aquiflexum sp. TKW24L]
MKFYFIGFMMAFIMSSNVFAQHTNLGIKGGLNVYNIEGSSQYSSKAGLNLGLLGHIHLTDQFALQPEILYSGQGAKIGNNTNLNLDYINVPVLLQYMFDNGFRVQAGPQLGFLVAAKNKTGNTTVNVKDNFESIDVGLGLGVSYVNTATGFGVDARYKHGLSNISSLNNTDLKNRGFQLGVFYLFGHKN